jgi:hypothetical protein
MHREDSRLHPHHRLKLLKAVGAFGKMLNNLCIFLAAETSLRHVE